MTAPNSPRLLADHHGAQAHNALLDRVMTAMAYHGSPGGIGPHLLGVAIAGYIIARQHAHRTREAARDGAAPAGRSRGGRLITTTIGPGPSAPATTEDEPGICPQPAVIGQEE